MNEEIESHEQAWLMLAAKADVQQAFDPLAPVTTPERLGHGSVWLLPITDTATLTHGIRELNSPLSE